jgi:predicted acylesterase/phospholipase RssA
MDLGLALGSGGARGWCHIGVLRALEAQGVQVDGVAGCSMGALVGAAWAGGKLDELENWTNWKTGRIGKLGELENWTNWKTGRIGKLDELENWANWKTGRAV